MEFHLLYSGSLHSNGDRKEARCLCPEKRVSGGKVLSCKTRQVKHRAATALRMGANSLCRAKGYFGEFFRRMRAKLGTAQAITATAHKIARILYHVLSTKEPYAETVFQRCDEQATAASRNAPP